MTSEREMLKHLDSKAQAPFSIVTTEAGAEEEEAMEVAEAMEVVEVTEEAMEAINKMMATILAIEAVEVETTVDMVEEATTMISNMSIEVEAEEATTSSPEEVTINIPEAVTEEGITSPATPVISSDRSEHQMIGMQQCSLRIVTILYSHSEE